MKKIEALNEENKKLQEELDAYKIQITNYQNQLTELSGLQALYKLDERYPEYNKTVANVFAKDGSSWFSCFYIDKGTKDGLYNGANVMCQDGLAGLIVECYDDYSKVRAIIDDNNNISAKILPSDALCVIEGNTSTYEQGSLVVHSIDKDALVNVGDKVVTSDISDRFHPGLLIGFISSFEMDANNLTMTAYITPCVSFDDISEVLVITDVKKSIFDNVQDN